MYYTSNDILNKLIDWWISKTENSLISKRSVQAKLEATDDDNSRFAAYQALKDTKLYPEEYKTANNMITKQQLEVIPDKYLQILKRGELAQRKPVNLQTAELLSIQSVFDEKYNYIRNNEFKRAAWAYLSKLLKYIAGVIVVLIALGWGGYKLNNHIQYNRLAAQQVSQNNTPTTVQVGKVFTVTLPCAAKNTPSASDSNVTFIDFSCITENAKYAPQLDFRASSGKYYTSKYSANDEYNYCTKQSTYTGDTGAVSYVQNPHTETINGITFSECGLSDSTGGIYLVSAAAISPSGDGSASIQINDGHISGGKADPNTLWSALSSVLQTVNFN